MLEVTKENFEAEVLQAPGKVLVDFFGDGCVPCAALMPHIHAFEEVYGDKIKFTSLNTDVYKRQILHLTQPTISSHISSLERELNIKLIVRTTKETYPSSAGEILYRYARQMLQLRESAVQAIHLFTKEMKGTITRAASTIPAQNFLDVYKRQ